MRESIAGRLVGSSVARVEDRRLLAGAGRYMDDVSVPDENRMLGAERSLLANHVVTTWPLPPPSH
jgi:CO/xanthine dehydrogenase Mo-binding subunit